MTDTDVTFLSCYHIVGHTRMHVMTLTSPPTLPISRPWAGLSMRRFNGVELLAKHVMVRSAELTYKDLGSGKLLVEGSEVEGENLESGKL
jgi:hypothetical protein